MTGTNVKYACHKNDQVCRGRELWADYFAGDNIWKQTEKQWLEYMRMFELIAAQQRADKAEELI